LEKEKKEETQPSPPGSLVFEGGRGTVIDLLDLSEPRIIGRALAAFEAVLSEATDEDLSEFIEIFEKKTYPDLFLHLLFRREAEEAPKSPLGDSRLFAMRLVDLSLNKHGFRAGDFYYAWRVGLLRPSELLRRADRHLTVRVMTPRNIRAALSRKLGASEMERQLWLH
jgi:hypothetical protein